MPPSGSNYLKSWFLFFLVASVGGAVAGGIAGAVTGGVLGVSGVPLDRIIQITKIIAFLISMPISFFTFRWSVRT